MHRAIYKLFKQLIEQGLTLVQIKELPYLKRYNGAQIELFYHQTIEKMEYLKQKREKYLICKVSIRMDRNLYELIKENPSFMIRQAILSTFSKEKSLNQGKT